MLALEQKRAFGQCLRRESEAARVVGVASEIAFVTTPRFDTNAQALLQERLY
jgi:hypothetical protein